MTWFVATGLGAVTGCVLNIFWPTISGMGICGAALIVVLLSVRLVESWRESR